MEPKEFGHFLRALREKQRLSLKKVAGLATMSVTYLWQIEKGVRTPSAEILKRLAPVYDVGVDDLLRAVGYLDEPGRDDLISGHMIQMSLDDLVKTLQDRQLRTVFSGWRRLSSAQKQQIADMVRFFERDEEKEGEDKEK